MAKPKVLNYVNISYDKYYYILEAVEKKKIGTGYEYCNS